MAELGEESTLGCDGAEADEEVVWTGSGGLLVDSSPGPAQPAVTATAIAAAQEVRARATELIENGMLISSSALDEGFIGHG